METSKNNSSKEIVSVLLNQNTFSILKCDEMGYFEELKHKVFIEVNKEMSDSHCPTNLSYYFYKPKGRNHWRLLQNRPRANDDNYESFSGSIEEIFKEYEKFGRSILIEIFNIALEKFTNRPQNIKELNISCEKEGCIEKIKCLLDPYVIERNQESIQINYEEIEDVDDGILIAYAHLSEENLKKKDHKEEIKEEDLKILINLHDGEAKIKKKSGSGYDTFLEKAKVMFIIKKEIYMRTINYHNEKYTIERDRNKMIIEKIDALLRRLNIK